MPKFVAWIDDTEPVTAAELVAHARMGSDEAAALGDYITGIVIPAARQIAERRSGAAIRRARFSERRQEWPRGDFQLGVGQVYELESITSDGLAIDSASYSLWTVDKDPRVRLVGDSRPHGIVEVTYLAGIETIANYPSVKNWILLAATWMLEQPSLFTLEQAVETMPASYVDTLLSPISLDGRV